MIVLGDEFTKYHGRREKVAVLNVPGRGKVTLGLSDTQRCARSMDIARLTIRNVAKEAVPEGDVDAEASKLHEHCKLLSGIKSEPAAMGARR